MKSFSLLNNKKINLILSAFFIISGIFFLSLCTNAVSQPILCLIKKILHLGNNFDTLFSKTMPMFITNGIIAVLIGIGFILVNFIPFSSDSTQTNIKLLKKDILLKKIPLFIIFLLLVLIRCYWLAQKDSYHIDELFGIGIVNQQKYSFWAGDTFEINKAYTGEELKDLTFFDDNSLKDFSKDMLHLWIYNKDTAYTSLYLMLFRLSFIFTKTHNFWTINIHGFILNLIFLAFSFYFLILLLNELTDRKELKYFLLFCAFANPASIGAAVYLRAYALEETILILYTYFFVLYFKAINSGSDFINKNNFIKGIILLGIIISSDYFTLVYVGILGLIILIKSFISKKTDSALYFTTMFLFSLIVAKLLYINWGSGFLYGRGQEVLNNENSTLSLFATLKHLNTLFIINFISIFVIIALEIVTYVIQKTDCKKTKINSLHILCNISILMWIVFVLYIAPYKTIRYIAAIFCLLPVLLIPVFEITVKKAKTVSFIGVIFVSLYITANIIPIKANHKKIDNIHYIYPVKSAEFLKSELPVVIYYDSSYTMIIPYLNDSQTYYFARSMEEAKTFEEIKTDFWYVELENGKRPFKEILCKKNEE